MNSAFEPVLEHALNFSRIHGWVIQLEDEIRATRAFFQEENPDRSAYEEILLDRLGQVTSLEEKLLLLVLLYYLEIPVPRIAELFLVHLDGKLGKTERGFLNRHFFGGKSPIPLSIIKEITDREFLNYHRAIYNALQISRFDSDFDADHVVLALVHLLCHSGLLAPNRAMILLLLSRIDAEMSPGLETMVRDSMHQLENVIREVESRRESVLKDSMDSDLRTGTIYDWKPIPTASPGSPGGPRTIKLDETGTEAPHDWSELRNSLKAPATGGDSPFSKDYFSKTGSQDQPPGHDYSGMLGKGSTGEKPTERPSLAPDVPEVTEKPRWEPYLASPAMEEIHGTKAKPPLANHDQGKVQKPDFSVESASLGSTVAPQSPRYTILFNRITNELEAVIHSLEETQKQQTTETENTPSLVQDSKSGAFKLPRAFWVAGALLLILFLFFVIIRCGSGPQTAAAQVEVSVPTVGKEAPPPAGSPVLAPSVVPQTSPVAPKVHSPEKVALVEGTQALPAPGSDKKVRPDESGKGLDSSLRLVDGHIFWRVHLYDTLWKLYLRLQNGQLTFDGASPLAQSSWETFVSSLKTLNPDLTDPDHIIPRQLIRLL